MIKRFGKLKLLVGALALGLMSSCGIAVDPLKAIGQEQFPKLGYISSVSSNFNSLLTPFTTSTPYWDIGIGFGAFGNGVSFLAPADGTVTQVGVTTVTGGGQASFITISHTSRLATRFYGVNQIAVRAGDFVSKGQAIGFFFTTGSFIRFQVLLDGTPVCPISFMEGAFLSLFTFSSQLSASCQ